MMSIAAMIAVAAVAHLGGGSDVQAPQPGQPSSAPAQAGQEPPVEDVRFRGARRFGGAIWLNAGAAPGSGDIYRASRSLGRSARVTESPPRMGISAFDAAGGQLIVASAREGGIDHVERVDPAGGLPGSVIGTGSIPAVSRKRKVAYVDARDGSDGQPVDDLWVKVNEAEPVRRATFSFIGEVRWLPRERIVLTARVGGRSRLVFDPGGARERTTRLPYGEIGRIAVSPKGTIAHAAKGRITILSSRGKRVRTLRSRWTPLDWSPDGRRILVSGHRGARIGAMSPKTGRVRRLGTVDGGAVFTGAWTR